MSGCADNSYSNGIVYEATIQLGIADDNISINPSTGQLTFDIAPDYETKDTYEITAAVTRVKMRLKRSERTDVRFWVKKS